MDTLISKMDFVVTMLGWSCVFFVGGHWWLLWNKSKEQHVLSMGTLFLPWPSKGKFTAFVSLFASMFFAFPLFGELLLMFLGKNKLAWSIGDLLLALFTRTGDGDNLVFVFTILNYVLYLCLGIRKQNLILNGRYRSGFFYSTQEKKVQYFHNFFVEWMDFFVLLAICAAAVGSILLGLRLGIVFMPEIYFFVCLVVTLVNNKKERI
jgi:hypothetical protein